MFKALLFDLDGTLLPNDFNLFIRQYFQLLAEKTSHLVEPKKLISQMLLALKAMEENQDAGKTGQEVFSKNFFPHLEVEEEKLFNAFMHFYEDDFPQLKAYTKNNERVFSLMEKAFAKGLDIIIATKPVFPFIAVKERLFWAGVDKFPYKLITSYENMHFCKPNPRYYQEILELINHQAEDCLMIGNDVQEDLTAQKIGIKTFLVEDCLINRNEEKFVTDYQGTIRDLERFIENI